MAIPDFPITVLCPWCVKGELRADKQADINVSCQCHHCGKYFYIDFKTKRAAKTKAAPRKANKRI